MKNAGKHAEELKSLFKKLQKEGKPEPRQPQDPLKSLVRGAMSFDVPDARAADAMKAIEKEFVDLNELRVATELEVQELLGAKYPQIERRVTMFTQALNRIFEREHTLSLDRLRTISKRDARQSLRDLPEMSSFVEAYVMLMAFDGHAVPVDEPMAIYLHNQGVLDEPEEIEEAQKFLEHHLKAEDCYDFYALARRASQGIEIDEDERRPKKKIK